MYKSTKNIIQYKQEFARSAVHVMQPVCCIMWVSTTITPLHPLYSAVVQFVWCIVGVHCHNSTVPLIQCSGAARVLYCGCLYSAITALHLSHSAVVQLVCCIVGVSIVL